MKLEIDIPEHQYNNIMALDSINLGRVPYKGIIMYAINAIKRGKALQQEPTSKNDLGVDCISRAEAIKCLECDFDITGKENMKTVVNYINSAHDKIVNLPRVKQEPKMGHCRDCKWWKDSDGAYRRGVGAESQCPINRKEVYEGNGYCYMFESCYLV